MELDYTEAQRDRAERRLARRANKRELDERHNHGIQVIAYWLVAENVTTIFVYDEAAQSAVEFEVDPAEVMEWFYHPLAHKDANFPDRRADD